VIRDDQPDAREGRAGRTGVAERFVVPLKPGNAGGGKGPQFKTNATRVRDRHCRPRYTRKGVTSCPRAGSAFTCHRSWENHPSPTPLPRQIPIGRPLTAFPRVRCSGAFGRRLLTRVDRSRRAGIRNPSRKRSFETRFGGHSTGTGTPLPRSEMAAARDVGSYRVSGQETDHQAE
jgi:hypothetical protein